MTDLTKSQGTEHVVETLPYLLKMAYEARERGLKLYQYDDPRSRTLGFQAGDDRYVISLTHAKQSLTEIEPEVLRDVIAEQLKSPLGRCRLFGCELGPDYRFTPALKPPPGLCLALMADAFALVEEHDIRVAAIHAHTDDWRTLPRQEWDETLKDGNVWGADLELSDEHEAGEVLLYGDGEDFPRVVLKVDPKGGWLPEAVNHPSGQPIR